MFNFLDSNVKFVIQKTLFEKLEPSKVFFNIVALRSLGPDSNPELRGEVSEPLSLHFYLSLN